MKSSIGIYSIVLLFLSLWLGYSYYTPLWNPPDEERHYIYCEYIAQHRTIPEYKPNPEENSVSMAFHPPLYYLIGSFFFRNDKGSLEEEISINDGPGFNLITPPKRETDFIYSEKVRTAYLLRLLSLILGAVTICLIYHITLTIFPGDPIFASITALFVATIPQFLHISASISNENLSTTLSTAYLLSLIYILKEPHKFRYQVISGILLGLCFLSKTFTLLYLPVTVCFIVWMYLRERKNPLPPLCVVMGISTLVSGWWYFRNWLLFNDPTLSRTTVSVYPWLLRHTPLSRDDIIQIIQRSFTSFFGEFGALQFTMPVYSFVTYGGILLFGIFGLFRLVKERALISLQTRALGILFFSLFGGTGFFAYLNLKYVGMFSGRYLFVVIAPIAIITCMGFRSLFPSQWRNFALTLLALLLIMLNLDVLFRVLKPAYAETLLVTGVDQPEFCCPTPEINHNTTVGQAFISPKNNLCVIRVMFSCPVKRLNGVITFGIKEVGDNGEILHQMSYPLKEIDDFNRSCFIFPPIRNSSGKEYLFYFSSPSLAAGQGVSLWYDSTDCYPQGRMLINGKPSHGDLYFQAYCFTGEHPETDWQGRREVVIDQGWYVSIRELQLYAEMSKEFREKTVIHDKLQRVEKALNRRKSSSYSSYFQPKSNEPSSRMGYG